MIRLKIFFIFLVAYWARVYVLQNAIKIAKQPDEKAFLIKIMDWLEGIKKSQKENESITNDTVAQAYLENYAHKLFSYADQQDRAANFGKNVVKSFYTAGNLYDIITVFGELSVEAANNRKYAKWKATYIHNCLKNGETPHAGPLPSEDDEQLIDIGGGNDQAGSSSGTNFGWNTNPVQPPPSNSAYSPPPSQPSPSNPPQPFSGDPFTEFRAPSPPREPEDKLHGFTPFDPSTSNIPVPASTELPTGSLTPDQMMKAQKYCKYAGSALTYDDVPTAIENLQKALRLLTTGQDS